ncbi:T9SS type A sorting domain-containing protein, partial [Flavobacteriales bacterium]|nr:T9SS type A sorting domain-containing protein [Flavobacteriales bacterium]
ALTTLACYSNQLTSLDVSNNTALTDLRCNSNQLASLDVSQNTSLTDLQCYSNQITSLDVSQNTSLTDLQCYSNQITSLDVSNNTALTTLWCYQNQLASLDLRNGNNQNFLSFNVTSNPNLTCINVGNVTYSTNNWTNIDAQHYFSTNCTSPAADLVITTEVCVPTNTNTVVRLTGPFWNWDPLGGPVGSANGDGTFTFTLSPAPSADMEYLFVLDGVQEDMLASGTASGNWGCTPVTDYSSYANRKWLMTDPLTLSGLVYGSCDPCPVASTDLVITTEVCGPTNTNTVVRLTGPFWNWDPLGGPVGSANGDGTFTFTLSPAPSADMEYLFVLDGVQEDMVASGTASGNWGCTPVTDYSSYANRKWLMTDPLTLSGLVYGSCDPCSPPPPPPAFTYVPDDNFEAYLEANNMGDGIANNDSVTTANINAITTLSISSKAISDLTGIEDFTSLTSLSCQSNQLTSLDVSQNTALTYLRCDNNQLTSLDVSNNTALTRLWCNSNQLTSLDVRNGNNQNLLSFNVESNPNLTCINVDDVNYSNNNWIVIDAQHYFSTNCSAPNSVQEIINTISLYPNPTNENITISINNFNGNIQTEVFDLIGNKLLNTNETTISLQDYARGIYLLKVAYGNKLQEVKVIKQ